MHLLPRLQMDIHDFVMKITMVILAALHVLSSWPCPLPTCYGNCTLFPLAYKFVALAPLEQNHNLSASTKILQTLNGKVETTMTSARRLAQIAGKRLTLMTAMHD